MNIKIVLKIKTTYVCTSSCLVLQFVSLVELRQGDQYLANNVMLSKYLMGIMISFTIKKVDELRCMEYFIVYVLYTGAYIYIYIIIYIHTHIYIHYIYIYTIHYIYNIMV